MYRWKQHVTFSIIDKERQHHPHILQDAKVLPLSNFQPNKVGNVLPHTGMAAEALRGAAPFRVIRSWWKRPAEERDHRGVTLCNLFSPCDK